MLCHRNIRSDHQGDLTLLKNDFFLKRQDISIETHHYFQMASTITVYPSFIRKIAKLLINEHVLQEANHKLDYLQVQKTFADCMELEIETNIWKHITDGLPAGQL